MLLGTMEIFTEQTYVIDHDIKLIHRGKLIGDNPINGRPQLLIPI